MAVLVISFDPVKYQQCYFHFAFQNTEWLNYVQQIDNWISLRTQSSGILMVLLKATTHIDSINILKLCSVIQGLQLGLLAA